MPVLSADLRVSFAGAQAFKDCYKAFLSAGAVMVTPQGKLAAFEKMEITLEVPGYEAIRVKVEVTSLMGGDALLRINPFDAELRVKLSQASNAAHDVAPAPPPQPQPAPQSPAPQAPPPQSPAPLPTAPPPAAAGPAPAYATSPSSFYQPTATQMGARLSAAVKPSGSFRNPMLPKDFLNLPLTRPPTEAEMATPATICLLMALYSRKSEIVALHVKAKSGRDVEVVLVRGDFVASASPVDSATKALSEAEGTYETKVVTAEPKVRNRTMAQAFGFALLKEYTKRFIGTEYADALSGRQGQSPRMVGRGELIARSVGLSEVQLRVATRMLTGQYVLDEVLNSGVGARSTWQMITLLQVLGGIEWTDAPPRQNILVDEMQATMSRIKIQDHFTAMGLHLSSSPQTIEKTYQRLRAQYAPGSYAHKLSPQMAEAIWNHMQKCYEVISTPAGRKAYRTTAFPDVRLDYAAQLVYDQARLAEMRREWAFALDQMNAVLELNPTREFLEEYRRMQTASRE